MRNVLPENYHPQYAAPSVQGTRGHQLAMYVVYENHLPMIADYPEAYDKCSIEFIAHVPTAWDETKVLHAQIDNCIVIARRKGDEWYLGGMTATNEQDLNLSLQFLGSASYRAEVLLDKPVDGPTAIETRIDAVSANDMLHVRMPRAGGFVARVVPLNR
jgi:alpha-glucosidase